MTDMIGYLPKDYDIFIGIDVDKKSFSFTVKDHDIMNRSKKIPANPEYLLYYIRKAYPDKRILCAYEVGPTGFNLYDYLTKEGIKCLVASPSSIPKPSNERVKTNRIDSEKIALYLRSGQLKPIRIPEGHYRELRHLVKIRENYVKNRMTAKQRIKGLLLSAHLYPAIKDSSQKWSNRYIKELKNIPCSFAVRSRLDMLLTDLEYARTQLLSIHKALKNFCSEHGNIGEYMRYLESIPGIGFNTAVTVLARIGDPKKLKSLKEIAGFTGLVPTERSTGETVNKGSITHLGDKTLRSLLIEAAWFTIKRDVTLRQFFHRIAKRNHPRIGKKKAIVAIARKLTYIIYRVLTEKRVYAVG